MNDSNLLHDTLCLYLVAHRFLILVAALSPLQACLGELTWTMSVTSTAAMNAMNRSKSGAHHIRCLALRDMATVDGRHSVHIRGLHLSRCDFNIGGTKYLASGAARHLTDRKSAPL